MPMQMQDGDHNRLLLQNSEENAVWKLWNQCTTDSGRNLRKLKRLVLDPLQQGTKFLQVEAPGPRRSDSYRAAASLMSAPRLAGRQDYGSFVAVVFRLKLA